MRARSRIVLHGTPAVDHHGTPRTTRRRRRTKKKEISLHRPPRYPTIVPTSSSIVVASRTSTPPKRIGERASTPDSRQDQSDAFAPTSDTAVERRKTATKWATTTMKKKKARGKGRGLAGPWPCQCAEAAPPRRTTTRTKEKAAGKRRGGQWEARGWTPTSHSCVFFFLVVVVVLLLFLRFAWESSACVSSRSLHATRSVEGVAATFG